MTQQRKLLLVAYHFPPIQGSTGTVRTVAFSRYLRRFGWDVRVLTIRPEAYEDVAPDNAALIPADLSVHRAWGLDARRHLSLFGRYPQLLALPDRWQSWIIGGSLAGSRIIRSFAPDALLTTYPIASAHAIGYLLHRRYGIPWIAEFRDPMLQAGYPARFLERIAFGRLERLAIENACRIVVTTEGCRTLYVNRYPSLDSKKITCISNGYDPAAFRNLDIQSPVHGNSRPLILLHSGLLYPDARNPTAFFQAVRSLKEQGYFKTINVEFRLRASGNEAKYARQIDELGIQSQVKLLPRIPYHRAIAEMASVDGLMLFQATNCNQQIPAKVYEYMHCRRPILALTDPCGDTGGLLKSVGIQSIARLEAPIEIEHILRRFLDQLSKGSAFVVAPAESNRFSRETLTGELARVLQDAVIEGR